MKKKSLYLYVSHRGVGSFKILNRQLDGELAVFVDCQGDSDNPTSRVSLIKRDATKADTLEQALLRKSLGTLTDKSLTQEEVFELIKSIKKLPCIDLCEIHLIMDVNLFEPNLGHITGPAHQFICHVSPSKFTDWLFYQRKPLLKLYGFSGTPDALKEMNEQYLQGKKTPEYCLRGKNCGGYKLSIPVLGFADEFANLSPRIKAEDEYPIQTGESRVKASRLPQVEPQNYLHWPANWFSTNHKRHRVVPQDVNEETTPQKNKEENKNNMK